VWFVHALAVITLALPILLPRVRRSLRVVGLVVATILVLSIVQLSFRVDRLFYFAGHNLYQPMIGASYFIFGAAYAAHPVLRRAQASWMVLLLAGLSATVLVVAFDLDLDLSVHSYAPDIYYVSAGFAAIAAMLLLKPIILPICNKVPAVGWALDFLSRHSYAVFLAHTFFIWGAETWFGLVDVGGRPTAAVLKIGFVLVATMAIAPWFTRLSARTGETIRGRIV
jgi:peptidoglycan/LPS O-acetylase OafA/YrhL